MLESVTQAVTVVWHPARYPVRWAGDPGDVPPFDPSRGGDPYRGRIKGEFFNLVHPDLGGGGEPPPVSWQSTVELDDTGELWPTSGQNYPRIVRASEAELEVEPQPEMDPLSALAGLDRYKHATEQFMGASLAVAERYGPLSFANQDGSLGLWLSVAHELHAHTRLLRGMQRLREENPAGPAKGFLLPEDREQLLALFADVDPELASPALFKVKRCIEAAEDLIAMRAELAHLYWDAFSHQLRMYAHEGGYYKNTKVPPSLWALLIDVGGPGQLVVRTGSRGWSLYQLWRIANDDLPLHVCQGCGRPFVARRTDAMCQRQFGRGRFRRSRA